jgi:hypothetical protein
MAPQYLNFEKDLLNLNIRNGPSPSQRSKTSSTVMMTARSKVQLLELTPIQS